MDIKLLEEAENLRNELDDLEKRLKNIEKRENTVISDSVSGSSSEYPYTKHSIAVTGVENSNHTKRFRNLYKKQIKSKKRKLEKIINKIEYDLNYIQNSEIRQIVRLRYEDGLTWLQIMHQMGYNSEENARIKLKRYFSKKKLRKF